MITIIVGTNREDNECQRFAELYLAMIEEKGKAAQILSMEDLPSDFYSNKMFEKDGQHAEIAVLQNQYIINADKFLFVVPEYNGSIPGILKLFIDAISVRAYKQNFKNKISVLTGIATGRAGNLRGLEHLTGMLMHMGGLVHPNRLPISSIKKVMDKHRNIVHNDTLKTMQKQVEDLLDFKII